MESRNLRITNWEGTEVEEISYSLSIKVPPKEELLLLLPSHLSSLQYSWKFHTGILAQTNHLLLLCLFREYHEPKVGVNVKIISGKGDGEKEEAIVEVRGIEVTYVTGDDSLTVEDDMSRVTNVPKLFKDEDEGGGGGTFWQSTCGWPDTTSAVYFVFHVVKRKVPRLIDEDSDLLVPPGSLSGIGAGLLSTKDYFLSEDCSDVTIKCDGVSLPAHRLILSNKSKYFCSMFNVSMKESKDGVVEIGNDVSSKAMEELLRFIYCGKIADNCCPALVNELFVAADKYGMGDLKGLCEKAMLESLGVESAMEVYDLCQSHGSPLLLQRAKEIILWNKESFIPDSESLKEFTFKYPELMFEIFQMKFSPQQRIKS